MTGRTVETAGGIAPLAQMPGYRMSVRPADGIAPFAPVLLAPPHAPRPVAPPEVRHVGALSRRQRIVFWALTALWLVVVAKFWLWWLQPEHRGALGLFVLASLPMAYLTTGLPSFYWFFVGRMRR